MQVCYRAVRSPPPNPPSIPLTALVAYHLMPTPALVVLTRLEYQVPTPNHFLTLGVPIIFRPLHVRTGACSESWPPTISSLD